MGDTDTPVPAPWPRPIAPTRASDEIARLGDEIYERDIRARVEADHHGKLVSIDVDSGTWAVGDDILDAVDRLRAQRPEAIDAVPTAVRVDQCRENAGPRSCAGDL